MVYVSKICDKYNELKGIDSNKMYLFKSGKFYIFIADDCDKINNYIVLKKVKFTNDVLKCGFPENALDDYLRVFKNHNLNIEIVEDMALKKTDNVYDYIRKVNINNITPLEALIKLKEIKELVESEK